MALGYLDAGNWREHDGTGLPRHWLLLTALEQFLTLSPEVGVSPVFWIIMNANGIPGKAQTFQKAREDLSGQRGGGSEEAVESQRQLTLLASPSHKPTTAPISIFLNSLLTLLFHKQAFFYHTKLFPISESKELSLFFTAYACCSLRGTIAFLGHPEVGCKRAGNLNSVHCQTEVIVSRFCTALIQGDRAADSNRTGVQEQDDLELCVTRSAALSRCYNPATLRCPRLLIGGDESPAVRYNKFKMSEAKPPPLLGQHTKHILKEVLGYDDRAIGDLLCSGVIAQHETK
ncbi:hypothetical protein ACRRTK_018136 [Alexandromys fortis]